MTSGVDRGAIDLGSEAIMGPPHVLRLGMWTAWVLFALYVGYVAAVVASGAASGVLRDPAWAVAEVLAIVGAAIQVILFAAIHECVPPQAKIYSRLALAFMLAMATVTTTVHFISLVVARRIDLAAEPALGRVFDFGQSSLLIGAELWAWHFLFGLSLVSASLAFVGRGRARWVRLGLMLGGVLCLVGLIGPAVDNPYLRLIGVVGYGLIFPTVCLVMGFVFRAALRQPGR